MSTNQERLYCASQIVNCVANVLIDFAKCSQQMETFDLMELAGRLDIAVDTIRNASGASR